MPKNRYEFHDFGTFSIIISEWKRHRQWEKCIKNYTHTPLGGGIISVLWATNEKVIKRDTPHTNFSNDRISGAKGFCFLKILSSLRVTIPYRPPPRKNFWRQNLKFAKISVQIRLYLRAYIGNRSKILHMVYGVKCVTKSVKILWALPKNVKNENIDLNFAISQFFPK